MMPVRSLAWSVLLILSGLLLMESSILSEVHNTSILRTGLSTAYAVISTSMASRIAPASPLAAPRSGLERSQLRALADRVDRPRPLHLEAGEVAHG